MKRSLRIMGALAMAVGLLWVGQGFGWVQWPQSSFMINQTQWAWNGGILALAGLALFAVASR